eukprot:scaffold59565_cov23-Tisochrysis_lutea.AAC.3
MGGTSRRASCAARSSAAGVLTAGTGCGRGPTAKTGAEGYGRINWTLASTALSRRPPKRMTSSPRVCLGVRDASHRLPVPEPASTGTITAMQTPSHKADATTRDGRSAALAIPSPGRRSWH